VQKVALVKARVMALVTVSAALVFAPLTAVSVAFDEAKTQLISTKFSLWQRHLRLRPTIYKFVTKTLLSNYY